MNDKKIAALILAAGESKRLGRPKQLLDWFGTTFINRIIGTAESAVLCPIIVVTGAYYEQVETDIKSKDVVIARNTRWGEGQSTSLIRGVEELEKYSCSAFVVMLCDQPQIPINLIQTIVKKIESTKKEVVATRVHGIICPPILFKSSCIDEIRNLKGDEGAKKLVKKLDVEFIDWQDEKIIMDVDTEEEYKELIKKY